MDVLLRILLIFTAMPSLTGLVKESSHPIFQPPNFDVIIGEIQANIAETVLLPCTVRNLGDKVVSWIRTRDLSILTSGPHTFSADSRFEIVYSGEADFWGLRIRGVRAGDVGRYECQVNTDPKMNLAVNLTLRDTTRPEKLRHRHEYKIKIKAPRELYVRVNSPISLTCEISDGSQIPETIFNSPLTFSTSTTSSASLKTHPSTSTPSLLLSRVKWLFKGIEINSESNRGGISVDTDYRERRITSRLKVSMVTVNDAGFYSCSHETASPISSSSISLASFSRTDTVELHVINGEEAMQRDAAVFSASVRFVPNFVLPNLILLLAFISNHFSHFSYFNIHPTFNISFILLISFNLFLSHSTPEV